MYDNITSTIKVATKEEEAYSDEYEVTHGLREGSSLSPLLYTVFVNDVVAKLEEAEVTEVIEGIDLRALLYADDMALVAASAADLQKLVNKVAEHANINQYQFSVKKSKHIVFGDDTDEPQIWLPANDCGTEPVIMKHSDRYTYLGLEFHEMLGAYKKIKSLFKVKRNLLGKTFVDEDFPEEGARIVVRITRKEGRKHDYLIVKTVPLEYFQTAKKDCFEDPVDDDVVEHYGIDSTLKKMIATYEKTTGKVRPARYPAQVWELHFEKMRGKMEKKRHILRRIGAHAHRLETKVATLVANTMMSGNATFCAEIVLATEGHEKLDQELMWARKAILGVKTTTSTLLCNNELDTDTCKILCRKQLLRFYDRIRIPKPPKMIALLTEHLRKACPRPELGSPFDTRNGWLTLVDLAKDLKWSEKLKPKGAQKTALKKLGRKWRDQDGREQAAKGGTAIARYVQRWPNEDVKMAAFLTRPCPMHLKCGKCMKTKIRLSTWRYETGAPRHTCPRCQQGTDSAEHLLFECPMVVPVEREAFMTEMESQKPRFSKLSSARQLELVMAPDTPVEWDVPLYSFLRKVAKAL